MKGSILGVQLCESPDSKPVAPHQCKAPSSAFKLCRVLISISGEPNQPKAPLSEFKACKGSDLNIMGAPSVQGPSLGVQDLRVYIYCSDSKLRIAHQSKALFSEFNIYKGSKVEIRGSPSAQRPTGGSRSVRVLIEK